MGEITADQALAGWRAEGITVIEMPDWRKRNRDSRGPSGPKHGMVNHHTGSDIDPKAAYAYADGLLQEGYSSLPGPLCHTGIAPDGVLYAIGWGRTNHAGGGGSNVLSAVINEQIPTGPPNAGNSNGVDGNGPFWGNENMYSGLHPMSAAAWATNVRWNAALARIKGWTEKSSISHGEWSSDKWDIGAGSPQNWEHTQQLMNQMRADIKACLALPPGVWGRGATPAQVDKIESARVAAKVEAIKQAVLAKAEAATLNALRSTTMRIVQNGKSQYVAYGDGTFAPLYTGSQGAVIGRLSGLPPVVYTDEEWLVFKAVYTDRRTPAVAKPTV